MNSNQIALIKESYMKEVTNTSKKSETAGACMRLCLDGGIDFITSKDLVVFDDSNELVHCISINDAYASQANYPIKIMSAEYSIIQQIETIMSQKNFEDFLDNGFISSLLTNEKKEFIKRWSRDIKNQAIQPIRPTPFYAQKPIVTPMPSRIIPRHDKIDTQYPPATLGLDSQTNVKTVAVSSAELLTNAIETANAGDVLVINNDIVIDTPLEINKSVSLLSNGATIAAPINITADNTLISGFIIDTSSDTNKGFAISASAKEFVFTNNVVNTSGYRDTIVATNAETIVISGNTFEGDGTVYNAIEFTHKDGEGIKELTIENNVFARESSTNNSISMYWFLNDAVVNIDNNVFERSANAIRISNYNNATGVVINISDNTYHETDDNLEYAGLLLVQGVKNEDFTGITVNISNLTGPGNKKMTKNGSGEDQIWYSYNTETLPVVNIK